MKGRGGERERGRISQKIKLATMANYINIEYIYNS
jgi:hypothetical protein